MHYSVCKYDSTHKREALDGKHVCKHISILLSLSERVAKNFANMTILYNACEFLHEQYRPICDAIPLQSDVKFGTMCASHWDIYQWPSPHLWKSYICVTWDIFPLWSRSSVNNAPLSFAPIFYMYLQRRTKISMRRSSFCITKFSYARICVYSLKSECLTTVCKNGCFTERIVMDRYVTFPLNIFGETCLTGNCVKKCTSSPTLVYCLFG